MPEQIECRDYDQGQHSRADYPANHWCSDAAHNLRSGAITVHDWCEPGEDDRRRHDDWAKAPEHALTHRFGKAHAIKWTTLLQRLRLRLCSLLIEIHDHQHANLDGNTGERNEADNCRDRKIVPASIHQP